MRGVLAATSSVAWLLADGIGCAAGEPGPAPTTPSTGPPWREISVSADIASTYFTVFTGVTVAPFGSILEPGWRLRAQGGYGQYRYEATRAVAGAPLRVPFRGIKSSGELMGGYQAGFGAITVKAFAGAELLSNVIAPADPANPVSGTATGAKLALESWLNIGERGFAQLDGSWSSNAGSYAARLRLGYRVWPCFSMGPELSALGQHGFDGNRAGGFGRFAWNGGELSLSAGVSGSTGIPGTPYGTVNWLTRY